VSPCNECGDRYAGSVSASFGTFRYDISTLIEYPLLLDPISVDAVSKNTIEVQLNVSSIGKVYCSAFLDGILPPVSVFGIKSTAVEVAVNSGPSVVAVNITNLLPDAVYNIYCYTEDLKGHVMGIEVALERNATVQTLCCESVSFVLQHSTISTASSVAGELQLFEVELDAIVSGDYTVPITITPVDCSSGAVVSEDGMVLPVPSPPRLSFSSGATVLTGQFTFAMSAFTTAGCYSVKVYVYGVTSIEPAVIDQLTVINSIPVPDAPLLLSVEFSADGISFTGTFDSATDRGVGGGVVSGSDAIFPCTNLISYSGIVSGTLCNWLTPSSFVVWVITI